MRTPKEPPPNRKELITIMSEPGHVQTARSVLDRMMADPGGPATIYEAHKGLKEGRWDDQYVDCIGQSIYSGWPMEQVAIFAQIHSMIFSGLIAQVPVATLRPPQRDACRQANAEALARLPHPFTAWVDMHQSNEAGDGLIEWSEPIEVSLATGLIDGDDGATWPISVHYKIPPGSAVLEIGGTLASRTWTHLVMDSGSVARWPYGHSAFRLLVNFDFTAGKDRLIEEIGLGELIRKRIAAA